MLTPNTYGQYPAGALEVARNVVVRAPGELWQAPAFSAATNTFGATSDTLRKLAPVNNGKVYAWTRTGAGVWTISEAGNACTMSTYGITSNLFSNGGQIWPVRMRDRLLVNTIRAGVLANDSMDPASAADRAYRGACLPQPLVSFLSRSTTNAETIPNNVCVGYAAILKRVFADGYTIQSAPSPIMTWPNMVDGVTVDVLLTIRWLSTFGVIAGDILEIYRTDGLFVNPLPRNADPGDTLKLINVRTLTATDISNNFYSYRDTTPCLAPLYQTQGRELYTNPGQETALQTNRQPDTCFVQAKFKTYNFWGDIYERPRWTFQVPAGYGASVGAAPQNTAWWRANGIGTREGTGTITMGSNQITGVSAANMVGIQIGQMWIGSSSFWAQGTLVQNVSGTTITMASNALSGAGVNTFILSDVIRIDGTNFRVMNLADFFVSVGAGGSMYEITSDSSVPPNFTLPYVTGTTVSVEPARMAQVSMTVAATNGLNYQEDVPEYIATPKTFTRTRIPNLLKWSKDNQPEHSPPSNETNVGQGSIIAACATKNALWIFCTDGLFRLSGDAPPWRIDLVDPSCILVAPQAFTQLRDVVYAYTNYGIVAITDGGISEVTSQVLQETFPGPAYTENPLVILERNEVDDELIVSLGTNVLYVFNIKQKAWTTLSGGAQPETTDVTALAYQRTPASGASVELIGTSPSGVIPRYFAWNPPSALYLESEVRYQPWYGDDPLSMKQFVDETWILDPADAGKTLTATNLGAAIATTPLTSHNSDAYGTVGIPRAYALAQSAAPGFTMTGAATQFKFRGLSLRFVPTTNQAWRR